MGGIPGLVLGHIDPVVKNAPRAELTPSFFKKHFKEGK